MAAYSYQCVLSGTCVTTSATSAASIIVNPAPLATVSPAGPVSLCAGNNIVLHSNTGTGYSYVWQLNGNAITGATTSNYTASSAGSYSVQVTGTNTCVATSTPVVVSVFTNPAAPINDLLGNLNFCAGDSVVFGTSNLTGLTYQWLLNNGNIAGATNATYAALSSGNYSVIVSSNGCSSTSSQENVTVYPNPSSNLITSGSPVICLGGSGYLMSAVAASGQTYLWYQNGIAILGATAPQYTATAAGYYNVNITNAEGCSVFTNSVTVTAVTPPTPVISLSGSALDAGAGYATYVWLRNGVAISGANGENYVPTQNGNYTVTVTDVSGCSGTSSEYTVTGVKVVNVSPKASEISIYPNPATSVVNVSAPFNVNISVLSVEGKLILQKTDTKSIDISQLANGMYMINIYDDTNSLLMTERLVKSNW